jgi:hypothetical protein
MIHDLLQDVADPARLISQMLFRRLIVNSARATASWTRHPAHTMMGA